MNDHFAKALINRFRECSKDRLERIPEFIAGKETREAELATGEYFAWKQVADLVERTQMTSGVKAVDDLINKLRELHCKHVEKITDSITEGDQHFAVIYTGEYYVYKQAAYLIEEEFRRYNLSLQK